MWFIDQSSLSTINHSGDMPPFFQQAEGSLPNKRVSQRGPERLDTLIFYHVAHRAGKHRTDRIFGFFVRRENENDQVGKFVPKLFGQLDPVGTRQTHIDNDRVWTHLADHFHALGGVTGFLTKNKFQAVVEMSLLTLTHDEVIVDVDNS